MAKMPWIQFFVADWLSDPELSRCSPATRGIWIDLLCAMHVSDRCGQVSGTVEQLARIARCTAPDVKNAINELVATFSAVVRNRRDCVTITNRRMRREYNSRESARLRKIRERKNASVTPLSRGDHASVTPYISKSESESEEEFTAARGRAGEAPENPDTPNEPPIESTAEGPDQANKLASECGLEINVGPKQRGKLRALIAIDGYESAKRGIQEAMSRGMGGSGAIAWAEAHVAGQKGKRDLRQGEKSTPSQDRVHRLLEARTNQ